MKRLLIVMMVLCPVVVMGQTKLAAKEFPLTMHVISSRVKLAPANWYRNFLLVLRVEIQGKKYVLAAPGFESLLAENPPVLIEPGNYPARIKKDETPNSGEIRRTYELRLPDGKRVKAFVWGVGG